MTNGHWLLTLCVRQIKPSHFAKILGSCANRMWAVVLSVGNKTQRVIEAFHYCEVLQLNSHGEGRAA